MDNWKKEGLPTTITNQQITIIGPDGKIETILKTNKGYNKIIRFISEGRWEDVINEINIEKSIIIHSNNRFQIKNNEVYINDVKVPNAISNKIIEFTESKLPVEPLLAFWDNLNKNPSNRSVNQLFDFLEKNNYPITPDGCFIAYRVVNFNFKDKYTNTMDNNIGKIVSVSRNSVNEDPEVTCSYGLHVANFDYANNIFRGIDDRLLLVKVNPKNVVAIPVDYNNSKMRVCEFEVLKETEFEIKTTSLYDDDCDCCEESCQHCGSCSDCDKCGSITYKQNNFECEYCEEEEEEEEEEEDCCCENCSACYEEEEEEEEEYIPSDNWACKPITKTTAKPLLGDKKPSTIEEVLDTVRNKIINNNNHELLDNIKLLLQDYIT